MSSGGEMGSSGSAMRIGITCYPSVGGSGIIATLLGKELAVRGHEVHFIARESPFRLPGYVENVFMHAVETLYYPLFQEPPHTLSLASKMAEVAVAWNQGESAGGRDSASRCRPPPTGKLGRALPK